MKYSDLPPGVSASDPHIAGYPETEERVWCRFCGCFHDDLIVVWVERNDGEAECPVTEQTIDFARPEPDPDVQNEERLFRDLDRR
jgi:hypothetical protein